MAALALVRQARWCPCDAFGLRVEGADVLKGPIGAHRKMVLDASASYASFFGYTSSIQQCFCRSCGADTWGCAKKMTHKKHSRPEPSSVDAKMASALSQGDRVWNKPPSLVPRPLFHVPCSKNGARLRLKIGFGAPARPLITGGSPVQGQFPPRRYRKSAPSRKQPCAQALMPCSIQFPRTS